MEKKEFNVGDHVFYNGHELEVVDKNADGTYNLRGGMAFLPVYVICIHPDKLIHA